MFTGTRLPLSAAQSGMWFAQQLDPDNSGFVTGQYIEIRGEVDSAALARAVDRSVSDAPELSARIETTPEGVFQVLGGHAIPATRVVSVADGDDPHEAARTLMTDRLAQPVDVAVEPGFGALVIEMGSEHRALFLYSHHLLLDVFGYGLLGRRIAAVYNALVREADVPDARFDRISTVLEDELRYRESDAFEADRRFWVNELDGADESVTPATTDAPQASAVAKRVRSRAVVLPTDLSERIADAAKSSGSGWPEVATAVVATYLTRVSGRREVTIGFPSMNRIGTAAVRVLTTAVNVVPLRLAVDPNASALEVVAATRVAIGSVRGHTRYRSEDVHRELRLPAGSPGLVGPNVNIKPFGDSLRLDGADTTVHSLARGPVRDITFVVRRRDEDGAFEIQMDADADRYDEHALDRVGAAVARMFEFVADPETRRRPVAHARLLGPETARVLENEWSGASVRALPAPDVLTRLDVQVSLRPGAEALVCGSQTLTYAGFGERVDVLANALTARGVRAGELVALALPRSTDMVVSLFAVLRTGAAYVPLDPSFPVGRLEYMLDDARPRVLLTTEEFSSRVAVPEDTAVAFTDRPVIEWTNTAGAVDAPCRTHTGRSSDAAYVIYTSGSTGRPKGVVVERGALARFVLEATGLAGMDEKTRLLAVTTLSFDIAVLELIAPLTCGGVVVVADDAQAKDPHALRELVVARSVGHVQATPSLWGALLEADGPDGAATCLAPLTVLVGGEALPASIAAGLAERSASVTNMYGPTEVTVWCTSTPVASELEWDGAIGRPFGGTTAYVLDTFLQPVEVGAVGELYVAGEQLARGYLGRPDLTATRFVAHPFGAGRLYRTGDYVRWDDSGALHYVGRIDDQVKIRGHRIELGDIESAVLELATVAQVVVVARSDADGTAHLVAYVRGAGSSAGELNAGELNAEGVRGHLRARLPSYMVPSAVVVLESFPLTPNLKVDRKALPAPDFDTARTGRSPETANEHAIAALFEQVLGLEDVGVDADFFTLGGTSLSATRLVSRIGVVLSVDLDLRDVFDAPTVGELAALVAHASAALPPVVPRDRSKRAPLSFAQQRMWFLREIEGDSATYNIPFALRLQGNVDVRALTHALDYVIGRHDVLRSVVVDAGGELFLRVSDTVDVESVLTVTQTDAESAEKILNETARRPFDLGRELPVRAHLVQWGPRDAVLLLVVHHIAGDEWSAGPLLADLATGLAAAVGSAPAPQQEDGRLQYADFAAWQRELADHNEANAVADRRLAFWKSTLTGAPEELSLPYDRPRPPHPAGRGDEVWAHLDTDASAKLRMLARERGVSMFMVAHSVVGVLLGALGAGPDVVVGAPVTGRSEGALEDIVGFFVNTIALRTDLSGDPTFADVLARVRRTDLDAFAHQNVPFERVVDVLGVTRSVARHPVFQVLVQHRTKPEVPQFPGLDVEPSYIGTGTAKFDLTFEFVETEDRLEVRIEYAEDLFDRSTVQAVATRLVRVLEQVAAQPTLTLSQIDVLLPAERRELDRVDRRSAEYAGPLLPDLLVDSAERFGERCAVVDAEREWTCADLAARADRLTRELIASGIGPGSLVALALPRTVRFVVVLRAVLCAGAAYQPIDPSYPEARIALMLADAEPDIVVVDEDSSERLGHSVAGSSSMRLVAELESRAARHPSTPVRDDEKIRTLTPEDLAYVVHTSGSTGRPKGVMGTAGALANRIAWQRDLPASWKEADVRLAKSSFSFIDGSTELLAGLVSGARLILADDDSAKDAGALAELVADHGVQQVTAVPSLAATVADLRPDAAASVASWFLSGEPLGSAVVERLRGLRPDVRIVNSYGSSEVAGDVTIWEATSGRIGIGRPVPGVVARVLDRQLRPVPDGVVGELYIGGIQLARGYLGHADLTAARFVADPFSDGERLFRTGDLVRRVRGEFSFVARADDQLNLHGLRIEPGEIEAALVRHERIEAAVVTARPAVSGEDQLVAHLVGPGGVVSLTDDEVRAHLRSWIPDYMVPAAFVPMPALPVLPNGKIDRSRLPDPERAVTVREAHPGFERDLCELLADLLGLETVGPDEDFFAVGGNSLLATRFSSAVRSRLGREVSIREIFDLRTAARLAGSVSDESTGRPPLVRREHGDLVPMSAAQQRLWFLSRLEGPSATYNIPFTMTLRGRLDADALRGAVRDILEVHESLRTIFVSDPHDDDVAAGGIGCQRVLSTDEAALDVQIVDVSAEDVQERLAEAARYPFDIENEIPIRVIVVRTGDTESHLMLLVHHIAADEWSARPLVGDLAAAYSRRVEGGDEQLAELPVQYRDFASWQPELLGSEDDENSIAHRQMEYWLAALAGAPEEMSVPRDRQRPAVASYRGSVVFFELDRDVRTRLGELADAHGATMFMVVHAGVSVLLRELGAGDDVVVGSPIAGRTDAALDRLVGFFVNTLVLRTDLSGDPSFDEVVERVRSVDLSAYAHQDLPFEQLVDRAAPTRSLARQPLFQILVQYRARLDEITMAGLVAEPEFVETGTSKFDLTFDLAESANGTVRGRVEYAADLFDRMTVQGFADKLVRLLEQVSRRPDTRMSDLDLRSGPERAAVSAAAEGRGVEIGGPFTVSDLIEQQIATSPDATALVVDDADIESHWTYREFDRAVENLATHLRAAGVGCDDVVAVSLQRSAALIVALCAVHRVGAAYLPLDDSYPAERLQYMLDDARPVLVIAAEASALGAGVPVLQVSSDGSVVGRKDLGRAGHTGGDVQVLPPDRAAYVLYTSGSTGRPKGVVVGHRGVVNRLVWMREHFGIGAHDRILQKTPSGFDVSVWEFFLPLISGATLVMARPDGHRDPQYLREVITRRSITTAHFVPSMLGAFLTEIAESPEPRVALPHVICSGEALTAAHRDRFHASVDGELHNLYGPTEAAVDVTATQVLRADAQSWISIGAPIWNTRTLVLDGDLRPVAPGVAGELYLGGVQLARGYHDRPVLTSERFVADPFTAGARLYRTGDLVRWRRVGNDESAGLELEYLGRTDGQVKLRGLRVELGEVESVLVAHPDVESCVVTVRQGRLAAYVVPVVEEIDVADVLATASRMLPEHMVPTDVVLLEALPLTPNGKLDRRALPEPDPANLERRSPADPAESALCELFAAVIGCEDVCPDDDFFMLGGDSIVSIQMVNLARRRGIVFGPREIFQCRTPAALARIAIFEQGLGGAESTQDAGQDAGVAETVPAAGPVPLTPALHRIRESGSVPAGVGAVLVVETPATTTEQDVLALVQAVLDGHDALRVRLTVVASVSWSLEALPVGAIAADEVTAVVQVSDDLDSVVPATERDLLAALDPEAGVLCRAAWLRSDVNGAGRLLFAVHPFAADAWSCRILERRLSEGVHDGVTPRSFGASARGLAVRINDRAQDPQLVGELTHWAVALAPGAGLGTEPVAAVSADADRPSVEAPLDEFRDALRALDPTDAELCCLAALAAAVTAWRGGEERDVLVALGRDGRGSRDGEPDPANTVGAFSVDVPVRIPARSDVSESLDAVTSVWAATPRGGDGFPLLRYLNAQTAPALAPMGQPQVGVRVLRGGRVPVSAPDGGRLLDVTVVLGERPVVRFVGDGTVVTESGLGVLRDAWLEGMQNVGALEPGELSVGRLGARL